MLQPVLVALGKDATNDILAIESSVAYPTWTEHLIAQEFSNVFSTVYGARLRGQLAAYMIVHTVVDEVHIVNLAVGYEHRRQGIARFVLRSVLSDLFWQGARNAYLEVRVGNAPARKLYAEIGFEEAGRRERYYSNNGEDALVLRLDLAHFHDQLATSSLVANE